MVKIRILKPLITCVDVTKVGVKEVNVHDVRALRNGMWSNYGRDCWTAFGCEPFHKNIDIRGKVHVFTIKVCLN